MDATRISAAGPQGGCSCVQDTGMNAYPNCPSGQFTESPGSAGIEPCSTPGLRDAATSEETPMTTLITHRRWLRFATRGILLAAAIVAPAWAQDETDDGTVALDTGAAITPA